jgi:hypothetical protein
LPPEPVAGKRVEPSPALVEFTMTLRSFYWALAAAAPAPLAAAYRLRLRSAWPALSDAPRGCTDPGSEALEGTLVRVGDASYEGRFVRSMTLRFCGPHGVVARGHCGGALVGTGMVRVVAEVEGPTSRPTLSVEWQPMPDSTQVTVNGDCPAAFATVLEIE